MTTTGTTTYPLTTPHPYQPTGTPGWRTCALCGRGANAGIHRTQPEPEPWSEYHRRRAEEERTVLATAEHDAAIDAEEPETRTVEVYVQVAVTVEMREDGACTPVSARVDSENPWGMFTDENVYDLTADDGEWRSPADVFGEPAFDVSCAVDGFVADRLARTEAERIARYVFDPADDSPSVRRYLETAVAEHEEWLATYPTGDPFGAAKHEHKRDAYADALRVLDLAAERLWPEVTP